MVVRFSETVQYGLLSKWSDAHVSIEIAGHFSETVEYGLLSKWSDAHVSIEIASHFSGIVGYLEVRGRGNSFRESFGILR